MRSLGDSSNLDCNFEHKGSSSDWEGIWLSTEYAQLLISPLDSSFGIQ